MANIFKVGDAEVELVRDGEVDLIRDVELAVRLEYDQPRQIRELIARLALLGGFGPVTMRRSVRRIEKRGAVKGVEEREVVEYWLTQKQAILVCTRSNQPKAIEITNLVVDVFIAAQKAHYEQRPFASRISDLVARILAPAPTEWEACFTDGLVAELCRLDGIPWTGGRHPRHLASTNRKIYDLVFSTEIGAALKAANPKPSRGSNHSQQLTPEARAYLQRELAKVEVIAHGSASKADFWDRMDRQYGSGMLQLPFGGVRS